MTKSGARLIRSGAESRTRPLNYIANLWSTAPQDPNFITDAVQRFGWSIVARQIFALPYIYCFIPCLTRRKWGLRKYWSLQSIQWYLYTNRVLATFFPCCNLSSRAVEDEPDEDTCIWKKKQQSTDNKLRQYQCLISGCDARQCGCPLSLKVFVCHDLKHAKKC